MFGFLSLGTTNYVKRIHFAQNVALVFLTNSQSLLVPRIPVHFSQINSIVPRVYKRSMLQGMDSVDAMGQSHKT